MIVPNYFKLYQIVLRLTLRSSIALSFLLLMCNTFLVGQSKSGSFVPTFARKDNTTIASLTVEVKEHGWLFFRQRAGVKPNELFTTYRKAMGLRKEDEMKIRKSQKDDMGYAHNIYEQRYKGILVQNAGFSEHYKNNQVEVAHGKFIENLDIDVNPTLSEAKSLQIALDSVAAKEYAWQNSKAEKLLQIERNDPNATYFPKGELVITEIKNGVFVAQNYRLAWVFEITSSIPRKHQYVFLDAHNGEIIKISDGDNHNGPAQTLYYGSQNIDTQFQGFWYGNTFRLKADDAGRNIHTQKGLMDGSTFWSDSDELNDADDNWGNDDANSTTAHWTVSKAWDFYKGYFNRNGHDGDGALTKVVSENNNNGSFSKREGNTNVRMIFFGENPISFLQESTIDIAAHEFTHGVLSSTEGPGSKESGLGSIGENGAIAESLCDIMGLMVERYTLGESPNNLTHGEDCGHIFRKFDSRGFSQSSASSVHESLRNLPFPTIYGGSGWFDPTSNVDKGGIHHNCSVMNFWFYLLTQGGSQNFQTVSSIGYDNAAQIVYRAINCGYLSQETQFIDARVATMRAARELFGNCSDEALQVSKAWTAVGIGGVEVCPVNVYTSNYQGNEICVERLNQPYEFYANQGYNNSFTWNVPSDWSVSINGTYGSQLVVNSFGYIDPWNPPAPQIITAISSNGDVGALEVSFKVCGLPAYRVAPNNKTSNTTLKVFPNPVNHTLIINETTDEPVNLFIFDSVGKLVWTKEFSQAQKEINVSELISGYYILKSVTKSQTSTASFIKR